MSPAKVNERVRVGCQGWNYDDWVTGPGGGAGVFYPTATRPADMLEVYARAFETVEVDSTFYAIPPVSTFESWMKRTPQGFTFSLKLPQEITHERALRSGSIALLEEFCERARVLKEKLASVLIQMPPQFELTVENGRALRDFLPRLPRDIQFSIEFRSPDWLKETVLDFLAEHNVALALVEGQWIAQEKTWHLAEHPTADFAYIRWMGARNLTRFDIVQRAQDENLQAWSEMIARLRERVKQVYAYFSNFYEGHAPASANKLKRLLGQQTIEAADLENQPSLF
ncbi:MAG: hypothetical protein QOH63_1015 [Acidobacteriota bacterium]|jgi:uncharacterized protein YecE (DUF72 family)|nr:hypothetical protein [Acidobacteriota bacterium]